MVFRSAWKIARGYWYSKEKILAWSLLITVIVLSLVSVYITVLINKWHSTFYQAIQNHNYASFINAIAVYVFLAVILVAIRGYQIYTRMLLYLHWRRWLTKRYLTNWLNNKMYYKLQLFANKTADNPDQRISEDVELFVSLTLRLSLDLLQDTTTILSFVIILWDMSGIINLNFGQINLSVSGYLVWAALLYAGIGTMLTIRLGKPLVIMDYDQQRFEADFRYSLVRMRENVECIAFYNGEIQERRNFLDYFQNIFLNYNKIILLLNCNSKLN